MRAPSALDRSPPASVVRTVLVAAGLGLFMVVGTFGAAHHQQLGRYPDAGAVALLLAIAASLPFRRRRPVEVLAWVWALTFVYLLADYPYGPVWLGLIVAYFTAVATGHRLAGAVAAVSGFLVFPWLSSVLGRGPGPTPVFLSFLAALLLVVFGLGEGTRVRRQRVAEAVRIRSEEAARRASEERLRIARELHDVLAHNISLINVQAGVALHVNEQLPEHARTALTAIRQASREALGELRTVLDVLRQNGEAPAPAPRRPAPGLGQLQDLVDGAKVAGLEAHVEIEGEPVTLPAPVDLAAYRIAQEALTNVIRHAGAANVWVRVTYAPRELRIRVEDDGSGPQAARGSVEGGGNGIPGMRERASALGGGLDTGSRPGGGFQVLARLPLGPAPEAPQRAPGAPAFQPGRADETGERSG